MAVYPDLMVLKHGQTEWNVLRKFQGKKDSPLTPLGESQALRQKQLLDGFKDVPAQVYVSPQGRAVATAHLVLGPTSRFEIDHRLREIEFGLWEGLTHDEVRSQIDYPF